MKRLIIAALAILIIAAGVRSCTGLGLTTLTVKVFLTQGGTDVTDQARLLVGYVPDPKTAAPTLGNIRLIKPVEGTTNRYAIPPDREIGLFAFLPGLEPIDDIVRANAGAHQQHDIVLDAGMVNVALLRSSRDGGQAVRLTGPDGEPGPLFKEISSTPVMLVAGRHRFDIIYDERGPIRTIDVFAGERHDLQLDNRVGDVVLELATTTPWTDDFPTVNRIRGGLARYTRQERNIVELTKLPFGTHDISFQLSQKTIRDVRPAGSEPINITIDAPQVELTRSFPLYVTTFDFSGWDAALPTDVDVMIFSSTDKGLPFAASAVVDQHASLVFLPPGVAQNYAVVVARGNDVLAIQDIGALRVDMPKMYTIAPGGDITLCQQITVALNCNP